jgi:molybdate transport system ATP-binding protein
VALARILASEPSVLMLDEPLSALDSFLKWQLEQEILRLRDGFSGAILFVSHNRDEVFRLCDRVIVMENGKTQKTQSKQELFYDPQTLSAALLSGCKNTSRAKKTGENTLFAFDWNISLESEKPVPDDVQYVGFRAHYFEIAEGPGGANTLSCGVGRVLDDVFSTIVTVNIEDAKESAGPSLRWDLSKEKWDQLGNPKTLYLKMPSDRLILLR